MRIFRNAMIVALIVVLAVSTIAFGQQQRQERKVLFEQFTGTWCGWCPYGHEILNVLKGEHGDNMILLVYHARDNLITEAGDELIAHVGPAYPQATVNRVQFPYTSKVPISRGDWAKTVEYMLGGSPTATIETPDLKYDVDSREVSFNAKVTSRGSAEKKYRINVVLTEDHILEAQKIFGKPSYNEIKDFYHSYVVREMVTGAFGEEFTLTVPKVEEPAEGQRRGRGAPAGTFEKNFSFKIDPKFVDKFCHVVVFVSEDNGDGYGPVLQAAEINIADLMPPGNNR
ncbi:Omp28-related outer membrane protein [candidate division KSB1 bacterium]